MATMLSQKLVEAQEANDTVRDFMRRFEVGIPKQITAILSDDCLGGGLAGESRASAAPIEVFTSVRAGSCTCHWHVRS